MKVIKNLEDMQKLKLNQRLPVEFIGFIEEQWFGLFDEQKEDHETILTFSLGPQGYIIILEPGDNDFTPVGRLCDLWLEYVELVQVGNIQTYRICALVDNDCLMLFFSLKDTLNLETEAWLAEQAIS